jgi:uncharacterized membrane protein YGL010W
VVSAALKYFMGHLLTHMAIWWVNQSVSKGAAVICYILTTVFHVFYKPVPLKDREKELYFANIG